MEIDNKTELSTNNNTDELIKQSEQFPITQPNHEKIAKYVIAIMKNDRNISQEYINKLRLVQKYGFNYISQNEFYETVKFIRGKCSAKNYWKINDLLKEYPCPEISL